MAKHTAGEITNSQIDEVSLVFQGADQDSELVVLTKSDDSVQTPDVSGDTTTPDVSVSESQVEKASEEPDVIEPDSDSDDIVCIYCGEKIGKSNCKKSECTSKGYCDELMKIAPAEWPSSVQKSLTDAVLSLYSEDQQIQKSARVDEAIELLTGRVSAIEESLKKAADKPEVAVVHKELTDDEILARASEIEAARKQAAKPAVVQKSVDPRLLEQVDTLRRSVEKLSSAVSREMGVSANH